MAIQPYNCTGRLGLNITVSGLTHKLRIPVDLHAPAASPQTLNTWVGSPGYVNASSAAQALWALLQPFYNTATAIPSYLVEENSGGVFTPLESGSLTGAATNSGSNQLCSFLTLTFKSANNHKLKVLVPEHIIAALETLNYPTGNTPLDALLVDFITTSGSSNVGNWARCKSDEQITRIIKATNSYNKRIRRSRHLV